MEMNLGHVRLGTDFFQALQGLPKAENAPMPGAGAAAKAAPAASLPEIAPEAVEAAEGAARAAAEAGEIRPRGTYLDLKA
jgi:hypothetical protein